MNVRTLICLALPALLLLVGAGPSFAQGTSGAASLNITPGARADAMGRANVALCNDATANWWNPAALGQVDQRIFSLMHTQLVPGLADDVYYEYLGYAQHMEGWGGVGASLIFLTYGKSIATDANGRELGTFSSYEFSPSVSLGTQIAKGLSAGVSLKYVYVSLAPADIMRLVSEGEDTAAGTGDTFGADLGLLYDLSELMPGFPLPGLGIDFPPPTRIGLNIQNLGPNISFISEDESDPIGRNMKLGIGIRPYDSESIRFLAEADINKSLIYADEEPIYNAGCELSFGNYASARFGYIYDKAGDIRDPTFGLGGQIGGLSIDYASVPQARDLPERVTKLSITYRF